MKSGKGKKVIKFPKVNNEKATQSGPQKSNFKDERKESVQLKSIQELADGSDKTQKIRALQRKADHPHDEKNGMTFKANKTGLPDKLKSGIENLSGQSLDDVKVHRNSSKPAQLKAKAFAKGTDIHLAPGQEKHLPHEAWHVVQQKEGRVKPTIRLKSGVAVNDDKNLENEADIMGGKAASFAGIQRRVTNSGVSTSSNTIAQRIPEKRKEFETIVDYFKDHHQSLDLESGAGRLIHNLEDYVDPRYNGDKKQLIKEISADVNNNGIMEALRKQVKSDEGGTAKWALILHHLKSATSDELAEYGSFVGRWAGRTNKWVKTSATLSVQGGMQYAMGNTVSFAAFASRAALNEVHLLLTHTISLSRKLENPFAYHSMITGVSELMEVSKGFETWTAKGFFPSYNDTGAMSEKLTFISNWIKKTRAGLTFIQKGYSSFSRHKHGKNMKVSDVSKKIHDVMGTAELALNSVSIALDSKNRTEQIINNIAKGVRHLLDYLIDLIKFLGAKLHQYYTDWKNNRERGTEREALNPNRDDEQ